MNHRNEERYSRQRDIVPSDRIAACQATVIGVGAIGRQIALQLTAMGVPWLQLIDHDLVEISNLASQGYLEADLGQLKVEATAEQCRRINSAVNIDAIPNRFRRSLKIGNALFCCVDSIVTRRLIWDATNDLVAFFCDGRMTAEVVRILTASDEPSRRHYPTTLFRAEEAFRGSCTAKTTIYCANVAAGLMTAQFARYLRLMPADWDTQFNLLSMELSAAGTERHC